MVRAPSFFPPRCCFFDGSSDRRCCCSSPHRVRQFPLPPLTLFIIRPTALPRHARTHYFGENFARLARAAGNLNKRCPAGVSGINWALLCLRDELFDLLTRMDYGRRRGDIGDIGAILFRRVRSPPWVPCFPRLSRGSQEAARFVLPHAWNQYGWGHPSRSLRRLSCSARLSQIRYAKVCSKADL